MSEEKPEKRVIAERKRKILDALTEPKTLGDITDQLVGRELRQAHMRYMNELNKTRADLLKLKKAGKVVIQRIEAERGTEQFKKLYKKV